MIRQQPHKSMILIGMDNTDLIYLRLRYISEYVLDILDEQIIRLILFLWEHMLRQGSWQNRSCAKGAYCL